MESAYWTLISHTEAQKFFSVRDISLKCPRHKLSEDALLRSMEHARVVKSRIISIANIRNQQELEWYIRAVRQGLRDEKSNEGFSGKGHAIYICKACSRLSPAQQTEQRYPSANRLY